MFSVFNIKVKRQLLKLCIRSTNDLKLEIRKYVRLCNTHNNNRDQTTQNDATNTHFELHVYTI